MAKLSVYNTIDRSQLGGKFVPLIQSGVNNYKILASDLGKEYSPGDAIEITDTGVINVNYDPETLQSSSFGLAVKLDAARGVFGGSNGIYIASANSSIGISNAGIKVNPQAFAGPGLELHAGHMIAVKTNAPLYSDNRGIRLAIGGGLYVDSGALYLNSSTVSNAASAAVGHYMSTYLGSSLSNDQGYLIVNTKYIASAGLTTGGNKYDPISVDIKYVANAIGAEYIGSGLSWDSNNYRLSANVNTATGLTINDNKLYLNAGNGLKTYNNTVSVKAADDSIGVSYSGVKVNVKSGGGVAIGSEGLYLDSSIITPPSASLLAGEGLTAGSDNKLTVNLGPKGGIMFGPGGGALWVNPDDIAGYGLLGYSGTLYVKSADSSIDVHQLGIRVNVGSGLWLHEGGLCVRSADSSIDLSSDGISVNTSALSHSLPGKGLYSDGNKLSVYIGSGLRFSSTGAIESTSPSAGPGLMEHTNGYLQVKSSDGSIYVDDSGISVDLRNAEYIGSGLSTSSGKLDVISSDSTISVNHSGIRVNPGYGLSATSEGLYVKSADSSIGVDYNGIGVRLRSGGGILRGDDGLYFDSGILSIPTAHTLAGDGLYVHSGSALSVKPGDGILVGDAVNIDYDYLISRLTNFGNSSNIKSESGNYIYTAIGNGLGWGSGGAIYVKSADNSIGVSNSGIKVNVKSGGYILSGDQGLYLDSSAIALPSASDLAGAGLDVDAGKLYIKSANGTVGVSDSGIGVNVTSGGGILTGTNGLYVDSGKLAGRGLIAHVEQNNVKLNVNVGQYDLSSNNRSSNLLKIDTATNALYVRGVDVTGIIGTNNTMTRQQDPNSYYHSFGVDVDYLFSTYTDRATLVYSGNKLSVHLSSIAGENIGYDPTNKSLYVSSGGSGGSIVGVDVDTPNGYGTQASEGGVAAGESAHANGGNSVAVGRLSNAHGTQSVAIGYFSSAGNFKSIAIGNSAVSTGHSSISIGSASSVHYDRGIAIGQEAAVYEEGGISIGGFSEAVSGISIGLGSYTQSGIAVGSEAGAGGSASIAIGNHAYVAHASLGGIAIGYGAQAFTASNVAIGYQAKAHSFATVSGSFATAGEMSVCSGYKASATNACSVVIGAGAVASKQYSLSAGYDSSANGEMSVAVGTHSIAAGYGCLSLGAFSNSAANGGVAVGYKANSSGGGIAIGYESSASDGMMSLTVYHSSGRRFNYSYDNDGNLCSMYSNSTSSGTYTRSWDNLLTPPNYNTAVSINTNTEYTADRPAYIVFNVYAGGTNGYVVEFIKNGFAVFNVGVLYGLTTYNIIPVSKGDKYKLNIIDHGATNPAVYAYRIYPS